MCILKGFVHLFFSIYKQPSLWSIYNISTLTWSMLPLDLWNHIDPFTSIRTNFVRCLSLISHLRGKQIKILSGLENESLGKFKIFINLFINFFIPYIMTIFTPSTPHRSSPTSLSTQTYVISLPFFFWFSLYFSLCISLKKGKLKQTKIYKNAWDLLGMHPALECGWYM